jgi:hypothetical protein
MFSSIILFALHTIFKFHEKQKSNISGNYRQQINIEAAYSQETKTIQHHLQTIKLATRLKIKSNDWK